MQFNLLNTLLHTADVIFMDVWMLVALLVRLLENAMAFNSATDLGLEDKGLAIKS